MPIYKCTCESEYQDQRYGKNMRVFNDGQKKKCTVCGKERIAGSGSKKQK